MAKEIERKFLVTHQGWRNGVESVTPFRQAYIASSDDRSVRVRIMGDKSALLTIKIGQRGLVRDEYEYEIPLGDARELMENACGVVIEKTRHVVSNQGFKWEIDVFGGTYAGLVMAEVELQSLADSPALPEWVGREVTGDPRYSNQTMALEDLSRELVNGFSHKAG